MQKIELLPWIYSIPFPLVMGFKISDFDLYTLNFYDIIDRVSDPFNSYVCFQVTLMVDIL